MPTTSSPGPAAGDREWTRAEARQVLATAAAVASDAAAVLHAAAEARAEVRRVFDESMGAKVLVELGTIDVERLRDVSRERLGVDHLRRAGITTVGAAVAAGPGGLDAIEGIGPQTAAHVLTAAEQLARAVRNTARFRIDLAPGDPVTTRLVQALHAASVAVGVATMYEAQVNAVPATYQALAPRARRAAGAIRRLFLTPAQRRTAAAALDDLLAVVISARETGLVEEARRVAEVVAQPWPAAAVWADYRLHSVAYYTLLDGIVGLDPDTAAAEGHLPEDLVARIGGQSLDESLLTVSLRGYQAFGAKYALTQRRVIIGDEMGLGKTVQAIAAIGHLFAAGATHALVVCPAGLLTNWAREIAAHSQLATHTLHGADRPAAMAAWRAGGGVALTSFTHLRHADAVEFAPAAAFVVDEAHYVKNSAARRSIAVARIAELVPTVLFLTGTAMENRVEELRTLVGYLRPDVAARIRPADGAAGPVAFRRAVAAAYLRRNREDVLAELPELVQTDCWEELGTADGAAYRRAVAAANFMAMRRAAFAVEHAEDSAKARRLAEIVEEACDNGRKVVVFSYFRDVVDLAARALGERCAGVLTGSVPPAERQTIIDGFTASPVALALVAQIDVGGVGLNLQAASVVVLAEPQLKPTTEEQAISRVHRMGQVDTVQVHRLLGVATVDERLTEILRAKERLFDAYARRSALAEEVAAAVDVSEAALARQIVAAEQVRLGADDPQPA